LSRRIVMDTKSITDHISSQFNADLAQLFSRVLRMGGLVERQIREAVRRSPAARCGSRARWQAAITKSTPWRWR
jgi:phosphate uptake regulator